jgi:hypothetical protein
MKPPLRRKDTEPSARSATHNPPTLHNTHSSRADMSIGNVSDHDSRIMRTPLCVSAQPPPHACEKAHMQGPLSHGKACQGEPISLAVYYTHINFVKHRIQVAVTETARQRGARQSTCVSAGATGKAQVGCAVAGQQKLKVSVHSLYMFSWGRRGIYVVIS